MWWYQTCSAAAEGVHLHILQWLRKKDAPCPWSGDSHASDHTCAAADEGGHLDVLKWLRSQDTPCPWTDLTCVLADASGQLETLQWALMHGCPLEDLPWLETLRMRLMFLTCVAYQQNSLRCTKSACTFGHHLLKLPSEVIQHIASFLVCDS